MLCMAALTTLHERSDALLWTHPLITDAPVECQDDGLSEALMLQHLQYAAALSRHWPELQ